MIYQTNEPYISNLSLDELRSRMEARCDPTIDQFLAALDERDSSQQEQMNDAIKLLVENLADLSVDLDDEVKQMEHLARNHLCLEPGDLWMLADRLDTHRINYAGHVDEALHAIDNGGNDRVYAAFVQRIADRQREREQAKKAAT